MIDLKALIKDAGLTQVQFADKIGKSQASISMVVSGKLDFPTDWHQLILDEFGIDTAKYNVNSAPEADTTTYKKYDESIAISQKNDFIMVPLVNKYAYASFSESWGDEEYIDGLSKIPTLVPDDGHYLWFEVKGDSMTRDEDPSINEGDLILGRELYKHHWGKLQLRRAKIWVINHRERGLMIKEIVSQSLNGVIKCYSWNPLIPEFDLHLDDIDKLYYVKQITKNLI